MPSQAVDYDAVHFRKLIGSGGVLYRILATNLPFSRDGYLPSYHFRIILHRSRHIVLSLSKPCFFVGRALPAVG